MSSWDRTAAVARYVACKVPKTLPRMLNTMLTDFNDQETGIKTPEVVAQATDKEQTRFDGTKTYPHAGLVLGKAPSGWRKCCTFSEVLTSCILDMEPHLLNTHDEHSLSRAATV